MNNEEQNQLCVRAKLVAKRSGTYDVYVFNLLDEPRWDRKFVMCTRCYNWEGQEPDLYQEGFLKYQFVHAGVDTWYDKVNDEFQRYLYTANYFLDFVPVTHVLKDGTVIEKDSFIIT